jgi:hypothetical protein
LTVYATIGSFGIFVVYRLLTSPGGNNLQLKALQCPRLIIAIENYPHAMAGFVRPDVPACRHLSRWSLTRGPRLLCGTAGLRMYPCHLNRWCRPGDGLQPRCPGGRLPRRCELIDPGAQVKRTQIRQVLNGPPAWPAVDLVAVSRCRSHLNTGKRLRNEKSPRVSRTSRAGRGDR